MTSPKMSEEVRSVIKLEGGPEGSGLIANWPGEPPDQIVVFRCTMVGGGVLGCCADDGAYPYMDGDLIYRKVSRSELFDQPDYKPHPNLMPGCQYAFIRKAVAA